MHPPRRPILDYANPRRAGPPADLERARTTLIAAALPLLGGSIYLAALRLGTAATVPFPLGQLLLIGATMAAVCFVGSLLGLIRTPSTVEHGRAARRLYALALLAAAASGPVLLGCFGAMLRISAAA